MTSLNLQNSALPLWHFLLVFNHRVTFDINIPSPVFSLQYLILYFATNLKLMARRAPVARQATSAPATSSSAPVPTTRSGRQPTLSKKQQENGV